MVSTTQTARALPLLCLALSGFSGLVAEVAWIRRASLIFGSTTFAVSSVIAVFMLGLALGSYGFGRWSRRVENPLAALATVELCIALLLGVSPELLTAADTIYGTLYRRFLAEPGWLFAARAGLVALFLLPATVFMGGTLPLFCRAYARDSVRVGRTVGLLYAVNTLGATVGCVAAGFVLLPSVGLSATLRFAALLDLLAAIALAYVARRVGATWHIEQAEPARPAPSPRRDDRSVKPATPARSRVVEMLFMTVGLVALGGQVLWTRYLGLLLRNTVYTYTLVLTAVLLGLVIGSAIASRFLYAPRWRALWFALCQVSGGVWMVAVMRQPPDALRELSSPLLTYFVLLLPQSIVSGATFPLAVGLTPATAVEAGEISGRLLAMNIAGGIFGALVVGFVVLPYGGMEITLAAMSGLSVLVGVLAWVSFSDGPWLLRTAGVAIAALLWSGVFLRGDVRLPESLLANGATLIDFEEGYATDLAVVHRAGIRQLEIDRWWQGEESKNHQIMAAHLPMLLHPDARSVLVVGVGTGQTPSRFLLHDIGGLDCVDIEPKILGFISRHFDSKWLADPRVRWIAEDGRNHLRHTGDTYDVISLEVGQLFRPGVAFLYTADFYASARDRLAAGGMLVQFVPLAFLGEREFRGVLRSFLSVFPVCSLWYNTSELLLVGTTAEWLRLTEAAFACLERPSIHHDLEYAHWGGVDQHLHRRDALTAMFLVGVDGMKTLSAGGDIYRDDLPVLDYATRAITKDERREIALVASIRQALDPFDAVRESRLPEDEAAAIARRRDANLREIEASVTLRQVERLLARGDFAATARVAREVLGILPAHRVARRILADSLTKLGQPEDALAEFDRVLAADPQDAIAWYGAGVAHHRLGHVDACIEHYRQAVKLLPSHAEAHNNLGAALSQQGRIDEALDHFEISAQLDPGNLDAIRNLGQARRVVANRGTTGR